MHGALVWVSFVKSERFCDACFDEVALRSRVEENQDVLEDASVVVLDLAFCSNEDQLILGAQRLHSM
ncbi:unnamed protein product [Haemonchus placei]|uniref:Uncharacterized protein n=1 Tax=Haemonchus placei TaxID=6290 RepID=A0A0N4WFQ8_HAEPC|nr:unnamed protein product [Haemonchus placei]